ncbi:MAG: hypothetical protein ACLTVB_07555 [Sutterella sp.]|jgi:hypothetical protein
MNQRGKADEHLKVDDLDDVSHWIALGEKTLKIEIATNSKGLPMVLDFFFQKFDRTLPKKFCIAAGEKSIRILGNSPR